MSQQIRISDLLEYLDEGLTREEIAEKLGINMNECRKLFQHPKLKGRKPKKPLPFILIDDTEDENTEAEEIITEENSEEELPSFEEITFTEVSENTDEENTEDNQGSSDEYNLPWEN